MKQASEEWRLDTRRLGRRVLVFDRLDSTNDYAASQADDCGNDGLVVLAREQAAGRGQYGRVWQCPRGAGVLLSVLLFPPEPLRRPALLAAWAAVSVCETVSDVTGLAASIKWPNDVLVHGLKVCGILIEQARGTVVGIGLNVNQGDESFAAAGLPQAASLASLTDTERETDDVARLLIGRLDQNYDRLCLGDRAPLEGAWKKRLGLLGRDVRAVCPDATHRGVLRAVGWDGIVLERPDGRMLSLPPETVRQIHEVV